jgi:hypothetical protein
VLLGHSRDGRPLHTRDRVYSEMYLQICMSYRSLPPHDTLTCDRIAWFYDAIRGQLRDDTKSRT